MHIDWPWCKVTPVVVWFPECKKKSSFHSCSFVRQQKNLASDYLPPASLFPEHFAMSIKTVNGYDWG
jgi:hypothetical protein